MSPPDIERTRIEKAKRNRTCYACKKVIFSGNECILNVVASWHINCFVLRLLELVEFKDIKQIYDEEFEDYLRL